MAHDQIQHPTADEHMSDQDLGDTVNTGCASHQDQENEATCQQGGGGHDVDHLIEVYDSNCHEKLRGRFPEEDDENTIPADDGQILECGRQGPPARAELRLASGNRIDAEANADGYRGNGHDESPCHRAGDEGSGALLEVEVIADVFADDVAPRRGAGRTQGKIELPGTPLPLRCDKRPCCPIAAAEFSFMLRDQHCLPMRVPSRRYGLPH